MPRLAAPVTSQGDLGAGESGRNLRKSPADAESAKEGDKVKSASVERSVSGIRVIKNQVWRGGSW